MQIIIETGNIILVIGAFYALIIGVGAVMYAPFAWVRAWRDGETTFAWGFTLVALACAAWWAVVFALK